MQQPKQETTCVMKRRTHPTDGRWIYRLSLAAVIMLLNLGPTAYRSQAQETDPKKLDAHAWTQRGEDLEQQQRYPLAVACYSNAIEADPDYAAAYFSRSAILADKNQDYRAAVADLTEYLRLRPRDFSGWFNREMYQNQLRDFDGAIADYTKAIAPTTDFSSFGGSADEARAHALHYRGRIYHWQKADPQKAIADYTESLKRDPTVDRLYYRRAGCPSSAEELRTGRSGFQSSLPARARVSPTAKCLGLAISHLSGEKIPQR